MICLHSKEHSCYWKQASYRSTKTASDRIICQESNRNIWKPHLKSNTVTPHSLNEWVFECPGCSIDKVSLSSIQWNWWLQYFIAQCTRSPRWHALFWSVYSDRHDLSGNHLNHLVFIHSVSPQTSHIWKKTHVNGHFQLTMQSCSIC